MSDNVNQEKHSEGGSLGEDMARAADAAKRQGAAAFEQVAEQASRYAGEQKQAVGDHLQEFARAVRQAGNDLGQRDQTMASQLVREAANGLESLSRSVNGSSVRDMIGSVREFGRANPAAFIGGAVLVGLALGRFARASGSRASLEEGEDTWRRGPADGVAGAQPATPSSATDASMSTGSYVSDSETASISTGETS